MYTCEEKFRNGSISETDSNVSLVAILGYKCLMAAILDFPPYILAPAMYTCVLRLKPRAASINTASSGVSGHCPSDRRYSADGTLI